MEFIEHASGIIEARVVEAFKQPAPPTEAYVPPESPRGEYGEPWEVGEVTTDGGRSYAGVIVNGLKQAISCRSAVPFSENLCGGALADRIVLCVNACRGLSDEALSRVVNGEFPLLIDYEAGESE